MNKPLDGLNSTDVRILIVDDEEFLVNMWKMSLKRRGYTVTAFTSSLTALAEFRNNPAAFDIVVTDQTMPGMTGGVFATELLKIRKDIPIIICTGYNDLINKELAGKMGIREYLIKPFDINQLEGAVKRLVPAE